MIPEGVEHQLPHELTGEGPGLVVLLHGLGANRRQVIELIDPQSQGARAMSLDLRAHGVSRLDEATTFLNFDRFAQDVEELVTASVPRNTGVTLVGVSMGAATAAQILAREVLNVRRLIMIRPAWLWQPDPENLRVFTLMGHLLGLEQPVDDLMEVLRSTPEFACVEETAPAGAQTLTNLMREDGARARRHRFIALPGSAPSRPGKKVPTVVVGAPKDPVHPMGTAEQLAADLDAQLVVAPPRYHEPGLHRESVQSVVRGALKE